MKNAATTDRLIELAEQARAFGRGSQADHLLLLAWAAYEGADLPAWRCARQPKQGGQERG